MKTKILFFLMLFASLAYESSAVVIIIIGGTKDNKYKYIYSDDKKIVCKSNGNNNCPVGWKSGAGAYSIWHPLGDLTDYVLSQVKSGELTGDITYEKDLPVRWRILEDKSVEITAETTDLRDDEKHEK